MRARVKRDPGADPAPRRRAESVRAQDRCSQHAGRAGGVTTAAPIGSRRSATSGTQQPRAARKSPLRTIVRVRRPAVCNSSRRVRVRARRVGAGGVLLHGGASAVRGEARPRRGRSRFGRQQNRSGGYSTPAKHSQPTYVFVVECCALSLWPRSATNAVPGCAITVISVVSSRVCRSPGLLLWFRGGGRGRGRGRGGGGGGGGGGRGRGRGLGRRPPPRHAAEYVLGRNERPGTSRTRFSTPGLRLTVGAGDTHTQAQQHNLSQVLASTAHTRSTSVVVRVEDPAHACQTHTHPCTGPRRAPQKQHSTARRTAQHVKKTGRRAARKGVHRLAQRGAWIAAGVRTHFLTVDGAVQAPTKHAQHIQKAPTHAASPAERLGPRRGSRRDYLLQDARHRPANRASLHRRPRNERESTGPLMASE